MIPQQDDSSDSRLIRRRRTANVVTWSLLVLWIGLLFGPEGPGRRYVAQGVGRIQAVYLEKFRWESIRRGSSVIHGLADSVRIVVFADYQCSFCREAEAVVDSLQYLYPNVSVGYRYTFPSRTAPSRLAAVGALCGRHFDVLSLFQDSLYAFATVDSDSIFRIRFAAYGRAVLPMDLEIAIGECTRKPPGDVISRLHADSIFTRRLRIQRTPTFVGSEGTYVGLPTVGALIRIAGLAVQES